jgi:hypothetical protein
MQDEPGGEAMPTIPAPDTIFGPQQLTADDKAYQGSRFRDVKAAIFANPYQKIWGAAGEPELPFYNVTNRNVFKGALPGGQPPQFRLASIRTLDSLADLRWGEDGRGFRRVVRPHAVCATGVWEVTEDNPYSGYFRKGSRGVVIARISLAVTHTLAGRRRSYGLVFKLYPTTDENHEELLKPANVILADDLGGSTSSHLTDVQLTNAPHVTGWNRGSQLPVLLLEGMIFTLIDSKPSMRQVYTIAELGKAPDEPARTPELMRLKASPGQPRLDEADVRHEVLAHIFDRGNPEPQRTLSFDIAVSDTGKRYDFGLFARQTVKSWQTIGKLTFSNAVASYNGDFVIHFHHPGWRRDRNDPQSAVRQNGKKVRWL